MKNLHREPDTDGTGNGHYQDFKKSSESMDNGYVDSPANGSSNGRAGEEMLSPEALAEIWAKRAYALAEEPPVEATGQTLDLLVFRLGTERYGLEVSNAREIHPLTQLTPVPRAPGFVAGVFSARGRILSVIDLPVFLGLSSIERSAQSKIMVVTNTDSNSEMAHMELGLLVDDVIDVTTIYRDDIEPPLTTHVGARAEYIYGVTADLLVVLNLNALLSDKRLIVHEEIV